MINIAIGCLTGLFRDSPGQGYTGYTGYTSNSVDTNWWLGDPQRTGHLSDWPITKKTPFLPSNRHQNRKNAQYIITKPLSLCIFDMCMYVYYISIHIERERESCIYTPYLLLLVISIHCCWLLLYPFPSRIHCYYMLLLVIASYCWLLLFMIHYIIIYTHVYITCTMCILLYIYIYIWLVTNLLI